MIRLYNPKAIVIVRQAQNTEIFDLTYYLKIDASINKAFYIQNA